jgi:hypothetical protein
MAGVGCGPDSDLDTDAPWPNSPDTGTQYQNESPLSGQLDDMSQGAVGNPDNPTIYSVLYAEVGGDEVFVSHEEVLLAPCDDFGISGMVNDELRTVEASYTNNDCGELQGFNLNWSFPLPETPGVWTLQVGDDTASFSVD